MYAADTGEPLEEDMGEDEEDLLTSAVMREMARMRNEDVGNGTNNEGAATPSSAVREDGPVIDVSSASVGGAAARGADDEILFQDDASGEVYSITQALALAAAFVREETGINVGETWTFDPNQKQLEPIPDVLLAQLRELVEDLKLHQARVKAENRDEGSNKMTVQAQLLLAADFLVESAGVEITSDDSTTSSAANPPSTTSPPPSRAESPVSKDAPAPAPSIIDKPTNNSAEPVASQAADVTATSALNSTTPQLSHDEDAAAVTPVTQQPQAESSSAHNTSAALPATPTSTNAVAHDSATSSEITADKSSVSAESPPSAHRAAGESETPVRERQEVPTLPRQFLVPKDQAATLEAERTAVPRTPPNSSASNATSQMRAASFASVGEVVATSSDVAVDDLLDDIVAGASSPSVNDSDAWLGQQSTTPSVSLFALLTACCFPPGQCFWFTKLH